MVSTRCFTYNQASYIEDALRGFAMQETTFPIVFIIIDDASTDGEPEKLRKWVNANMSKNDNGDIWRVLPYGELAVGVLNDKDNSSFVILLLNENHYQRGRGKKRFEYITEWDEKSKYIGWCEGDDYWMDPYKLQKQVELMEEDSTIGLVHTDCSVSYSNSNQHFINRNETRNTEIDTSLWEESIESIYKGDLVIRTCTALMNADLLKEIKKSDPFLFDGHLALGDTQTWVGVLLKQKKIGYIDEETAVYRVLRDSASHAASYQKQLLFAISRYEIRLYYQRKYNVLKELDNTERTYYQYVRIFRILFNPHYKDIDGNTEEANYLFKILSKFKFVRLILKMLLKAKHSIG